jgi:hypothetical protein
MAYFWAFMTEIFGHLFDLGGAQFMWNTGPAGSLGIPSHGQYVFTGAAPNLTAKGQDIVAALMTIVHNGIVALAQISTLLPYNALS